MYLKHPLQSRVTSAMLNKIYHQYIITYYNYLCAILIIGYYFITYYKGTPQPHPYFFVLSFFVG